MTTVAGRAEVTHDLIRVLVADARGPERLRCRLDLADDGFAVVAEAVEARQAVAVAAFEAPDVVILDPDLPNDHHVDVLSELNARAPRAAVLLYRPEDAGDLQAVVRQAVARPAAIWI